MTAPTSQPDAHSNTREAARAATAVVNVCLPATVVSYDHTTQVATVKVVPKFRRKDPGKGNQAVAYDPPDLPGVPVAFPGGGDYSITWPLQPGDTGRIVVCDRSLDEWKATGAARTEPQDQRRHNLSDAIFVPDLRSPKAPREGDALQPDGMVVRATTKVVVDCPDVRLGSNSATKGVALGPDVHTQLLAIKSLLDNWVPSAGDGGAALKTAWTALSATGWPADTSASKVVAE